MVGWLLWKSDDQAQIANGMGNERIDIYYMSPYKAINAIN